jgi:predicted transcriptional regulator
LTDTNPDAETLLALTADIVSAHVGYNNVGVGDVPALIVSVHAALSELGTPAEEAPPVLTPAVSIRASIRPAYLVCLEDGKKLKMLKRHLMTHHALTPAAYRAKWNLPADYPMVAPDYAEARRVLAKAIGLGRKPAPAPKATRAKGAKLAKAKTAAPRGKDDSTGGAAKGRRKLGISTAS